jgi:GNAT superfamily N-acetyltransferase
MKDSVIDIVGRDEMPVLVEMYNRVFRPHRDVDSFERRFRSRLNVLRMIARVKSEPVGFFLGFELKPTVYFSWFIGVVPEYRRLGVGSQLLEAVHEWVEQQGYDAIRFECFNQHRPMLHLALSREYDIVGIRWDGSQGENLIIFEKTLNP